MFNVQDDVYTGKDCVKKFCESLREYPMKIVKKIKLLTNEYHTLYQNSKICNICQEKLEDKHAADKKMS